MTWTMEGTKVRHEWMPLAFANGIEWSTARTGKADRFDNLYSRTAPVLAFLWLCGAVAAVLGVRIG